MPVERAPRVAGTAADVEPVPRRGRLDDHRRFWRRRCWTDDVGRHRGLAEDSESDEGRRYSQFANAEHDAPQPNTTLRLLSINDRYRDTKQRGLQPTSW